MVTRRVSEEHPSKRFDLQDEQVSLLHRLFKPVNCLAVKLLVFLCAILPSPIGGHAVEHDLMPNVFLVTENIYRSMHRFIQCLDGVVGKAKSGRGFVVDRFTVGVNHGLSLIHI